MKLGLYAIYSRTSIAIRNFLFRHDKSLRIFSVLLVSLSLVTSFQNCGRAGVDGSLEEPSLNLSEEIDLKSIFGTDAEKVSAIDFAFDASLDQITYNSCASQGLNSSLSYFTVRAGAYSNGGIRISQQFFDYAVANFNGIDGAPLSNNQLKRFLAYSPNNAAAKLQMSVRRSDNVRTGVIASGSPTEGTSYITMGLDLTDDRMMDPLISTRGNVTYFPLVSSYTKRRAEGSISFNSSVANEHELRSALEGISQSLPSSSLVLTYTSKATGALPYTSRAPAGSTDNTLAYGKRYVLDFSSLPSRFTDLLIRGGVSSNSGVFQNAPQNLLTGVTELDLLTNDVPAGGYSWNCSRRYVVIRKEDADKNPALCPSEGIDLVFNPSYLREIELVRRHLPAGDWDINASLGCVVPRSTNFSCYPSDNLGIAYDQTTPCFHEGSNPDATANPPLPRCANHITICVRQ